MRTLPVRQNGYGQTGWLIEPFFQYVFRPSDGAAGAIFEALSHVDCSINPHEIQQKAGAGASCSSDPGAN